MSLLLAHNVSWRSAAPCLELGVDRKWPARYQSDAGDPDETSAGALQAFVSDYIGRSIRSLILTNECHQAEAAPRYGN